MPERGVPVYLITGFIESGKTTFLTYSLQQRNFMIPGRTVLIQCEEGEEDYDQRDLTRARVVVEKVDAPEKLTPQFLQQIDRKHRPARVLIEYNAFWGTGKIYEMEKPRKWELVQHIVTVDATTFKNYLNNMRSIFTDMINGADMVVFNRCRKEDPLANYRRSVKVVSPMSDVLFEGADGNMIDIFEDSMPFSLDTDPIRIEDIDYGLWYMDMRDHPDRYTGKRVQFKGVVLKSENDSADYFVPGRRAMTCCADDIRFLGYVCKTAEAKTLKMGDWVEVTGTVKQEYNDMYQETGPVIYPESITPAEKPQEELVFFS